MSADQKPEAQAVAPVPMPLPIVAWLASTTDGEYALAMSRVGAIQRAGSNVDDIVPLTPHAMAVAAIDAAVAEAVAAERALWQADAERWRETGDEDPADGQEVLAAIWPYGNKENRLLIVHAIYHDGQWLCPAERTSLHAPGYWKPAPAMPDAAIRRTTQDTPT